MMERFVALDNTNIWLSNNNMVWSRGVIINTAATKLRLLSRVGPSVSFPAVDTNLTGNPGFNK